MICEQAVGRIQFKEHQRALRASLLHVDVIRWLFGVISDTPNTCFNQLSLLISLNMELAL